jgi:hypothetical protein
MFLNLLKYEYRYMLTRVSTYVYTFIFFALGVFIMNAMGGAFTGVRMSVSSGSEEQVFTNASAIIMMVSSALNLLLILFAGGYMSDILLKDYSHNAFQLVYTKQVKKITLFSSRLIVAITMVLGMFAFVSLGLIVGRFSPWLDTKQFQPFNIAYYISPYLKISVTNVIFASSLFALIAYTTKKKLYVNLSAVILYILYSLIIPFGYRLEYKEITAILDPFAISTMGIMTENWSIAQRNTFILPFESYLLYNRLLWLGIALVIYIISYNLYKFAYPTGGAKKRDVKEKHEKADYHKISKISIKWNIATYLTQLKHYFTIEFRILYKSVMFKVFLVLYILLLFSSLSNMSVIYDTSVHPVTYKVAEVLANAIEGFAFLFIAIFGAELFWKSRANKCDMFEDAAPFASGLRVVSHFLTLNTYSAIFWLIGSLSGIIYQLTNGFYAIELDLYLKFGGIYLLQLIPMLCVSLFILNITPNRISGIFAVFGFSVAKSYISSMGLEHPLWQLFQKRSFMYSDMNGFGSYLPKLFTFEAYWGSLGLILLLFTARIYRRGTAQKIKDRVMGIRFGWKIPQTITLIILISTMLSAGGYIFYNTNVINDYRTMEESRLANVKYENTYKYLDGLIQPRVTDVDLNVQFYPKKLDAGVSGNLILRNKSNCSIDSLLFYLNESDNFVKYSIDRDFKQLLHDEDYGMYIVRLNSPLLEGDSLNFYFEDYHPHKGYQVDTNVCENGSFVNSAMFMPTFGYSDSFEIGNNELRKKYGLKPKERMAANTDIEARKNTYISKDSDWVNFKATVGTSADQIAVAPGYLTKSWEENGRKQFRYEMDMPILKFFSFVSARYELATDSWTSPSGKEVSLEIYHHKGHDYNHQSMFKALKMGLSHYSNIYMEYPHKQMRILEFPRYSTFAQSFPNTVPYSEGIGFIADVEDHDKKDYPFFVTAHELAHQWWAHIVIGADVQGAVLMSEALAQYSALSIMEQEYGEVMMGEFLKHELSSYINGRSSESSKEQPLSKVENQQYIHYYKGSVVMFGLKGYIGEDKVNAALKEVVDTYKYQEAPYINSPEFLECLYKQVPDSLLGFAHELFEDIVLYNNSVKDLEVTQTSDSLYSVDLVLESHKVRADSIGNETEITMSDWVEVLVFSERFVNGEKEKIIANPHNRWFKLQSGENKIKLTVDKKPVEAGVDPLFKLLDKTVYNNTKSVTSIKKG